MSCKNGLPTTTSSIAYVVATTVKVLCVALPLVIVGITLAVALVYTWRRVKRERARLQCMTTCVTNATANRSNNTSQVTEPPSYSEAVSAAYSPSPTCDRGTPLPSCAEAMAKYIVQRDILITHIF